MAWPGRVETSKPLGHSVCMFNSTALQCKQTITETKRPFASTNRWMRWFCMSHRGLLAIENWTKGAHYDREGLQYKNDGLLVVPFRAGCGSSFKRCSASKRPQWELPRYLFIGHCTETKYDRKHFRSKQNLAIFNISDEHPRTFCIGIPHPSTPLLGPSIMCVSWVQLGSVFKGGGFPSYLAP